MRQFRPPTSGDEADVRAAQAELAVDEFLFAHGLGADFDAWVDRCRREAAGDVPSGWVRTSMVLAVQEGEVVGRVSIRHDLNAALEDDGGHVGYAVRPMHRRRGHAAALLGHALHVLAAEGTTDALLTCDERNTGSRRTIERAGGRLQQVRLLEDGEVQRRYRVPTQGAAAGPAGRDR